MLMKIELPNKILFFFSTTATGSVIIFRLEIWRPENALCIVGSRPAHMAYA